MPHDFAVGTMLWQNLSEQKIKVDKQRTPQTAAQMVEDIQVPLMLDPEALSWIEKALRKH